MTRLVFLRHGKRPDKGTDDLDAIGEAQACAAGALLRAHGVHPALAVHTDTRRTEKTVVLALGGRSPRLSVPSAPRRASDLPARLREWCQGEPDGGPVLLCAHHTTQASLLKLLGVKIRSSHRALVVVDVEQQNMTFLRAWACPEDSSDWQPLEPLV